jgi:hypothetical protein
VPRADARRARRRLSGQLFGRRFGVDKKQYFTLDDVPRHAPPPCPPSLPCSLPRARAADVGAPRSTARPFVNFFASGDGATLLAAEDGPAIPPDML